jgi:GST-like protein
MSEAFVIHGEAGSGSVAVEAALTLLGAPYRLVETTTANPAGSPGTPMGQVPTLRLPGGAVMTESAAILTWLADSHPASCLSPRLEAPERPAFLRWMAFVSAAIYAHYWARDFPERLVTAPEARAELRARLEARIVHGWSVVEAALEPGAYLLGEDLTVLDLYVTVVSRWTPRKPLHETIAPRLGAVARRVEADPRLAALWAERFPLSAADDA